MSILVLQGIYRDIINWRDSVAKLSVDQPGFLPFIPLYVCRITSQTFLLSLSLLAHMFLLRKSITVKCNRDSGYDFTPTLAVKGL